MTEKQFATAVSNELANEGYAFDPATIITLLTLLLPLIQQLPCFKKSPSKMRAAIDAEFRECCKKRKGRCPAKARKLLKDEMQVIERYEQDDFWNAACKVAFANRDAVAEKLVTP